MKTKEAKYFRDSEVEMVEVMDTLQHTIQSLRKRWPRTLHFAEGNQHTEHGQRRGNAHHKEDLIVNSLQQTVSMMRRNTEQINDQFREKPGTLTTVEHAHNDADDGRHVVTKTTVQSKDRRDSMRH